jgi:hypothetical protein
MPFMLFLQSLLFALPHALWCSWEGGLVRGSLTGLKDEIRGPNRDKLRTLALYFAARLHTFHMWAAGFYGCQLLNMLNVVTNIFLTDRILGGNFYEYGLQMGQYGLQVSGNTVLCCWKLGRLLVRPEYWHMVYFPGKSFQDNGCDE